MRGVAEYVNEKKREAENLSQVLAIHDRLSGKFEVLSYRSLACAIRSFVRLLTVRALRLELFGSKPTICMRGTTDRSH